MHTKIDKNALKFTKKHKQAKIEFSDQKLTEDKLKKQKASYLKEHAKLKVLITDIDRRKNYRPQ